VLLEQKYVGPERVPWTIQQTFLGIFLTIVPWVLLSFALSSAGSGGPTSPISPQADRLAAIVTFIFDTCIEGAFLIAPLYFAMRAFRGTQHRLPRALELLGFRRFRIGQTLVLIVVLFISIYAVNLLYQSLIITFHLRLQTNDQVLLDQGHYAPITTYATLFVAVFIAPICEEVFFRSFVFNGLRNAMPLSIAIVLSALIFGVAHGDFGSFAVLVIIGLALALVRWRTRSIWPGIFLHMLNNGFSAVLLILALQGVIK
jgi:membrane protease YdiL (CAAX protease family)